MRILIASDTFSPDVNGAARFSERLARGLLARGHEVHVVAPSQDDRDHTQPFSGLVVHRVHSVRYPLAKNFRICMPWRARPRLLGILREVRPDVVHVQNHFLVGRYATRLAAQFGIPVVATNHFMPENLVDHARIPRFARDFVSRAAWWDVRRTFRSAKILTAPTPRAVELLERMTGLTGARAVSCGVDLEPYQAAARAALPTDVPVILFVGRLDQEKRVNELLAAVASLPAERQWRLELVGDGAYAIAWRRLAGELGIADRVDFLGFVGEEELLRAYGRCAIFCIPGVAELQSLVTLEAMSAGKPIVAANAMALPHLVHPGENGWLYEPGDVGDLAARLDSLLVDPSMRARMGSRSLELVAGHAISATLEAFEGIYGEAVADRVGAARP